jgi:C1A family cysteine protease
VIYVDRELDFIHNRKMNGKQLAVLLAVIGAAAVLLNVNNASTASEFESWKGKHGIKFASEFENAYRERIFLENLAKVNSHNSNPYKTYEQGLNQFSALTTEEFAQQYLGTIVAESSNNIESTDDLKVGDVDWTTQGAVTGVKNQGQCGSCWAFSATGGLEGLSKLAYGTLESFSEQQLVDCSGSYGNQACNGGLMDNAFKFVKDNGIVHEDQYVYKAVKQTCSQKTGPFKISGFTDIKNCNDLATAIAGRPISVAVDATNWSPYKSGVFNNCKTSLNHGVLLVGLTDQYWHVKNSWGTSWGESGFVRLARGNTCGICNVASYPNK